ncbi:MarR family winged helix-turn-helix transcriptional regulator [Vibrio vulnificus]|uniref:MarR family winged helix-turn-helix transcriptional regulator n=1 Tax=Vibrio vulnificus TaxID=672 RepID=UPI0002F94427|nr:MarR family transcriptional regulator [Vibrio vulnificus]AUL98203.1 Organic hydroperoxide resistance transcriptional regulator [Vibrio vulnificus]AVX01346.1 MarR family transcriptional regulator [Vibrio vulnificus Env1]EGQ7940906.1 MarR family transcriptional regulator [Vibrio vulnificus]EGQ9275637.1 MarR family transcriptional regulator [Vibrio vulnificus]EGQ9281217.1 MarR family transcriptional regulator [Vibrio vulnificus]
MSEQTIRCQGDSEAQLLLENQICFPLYSAANAVIRAYRPLLDALDLTYSQYLVLLVLWQQNGINVKDLGAKLHLDSGTLTPLLKRLEAKGIVERRRGQTDERVRELFLTEAGRALKQQAHPVPQNMLCRIDLSIDELVTLKSLCEKVLEKLN